MYKLAFFFQTEFIFSILKKAPFEVLAFINGKGMRPGLEVFTLTFKEQRNGKRDRIMYHHVAASHIQECKIFVSGCLLFNQ